MVDGASAWQRFWKITIPVVKPFILLIAVYTVVDIALSSLSPFTKVIQDGMFAPSKASASPRPPHGSISCSSSPPCCWLSWFSGGKKRTR